MKTQVNAKITIDTDEVFSHLRDTYNDSQLARIAIRIGEKKRSDNWSYYEILLHEVSRVVARQFREDPSLRDEAPDYARAVEFLANNDPNNL